MNVKHLFSGKRNFFEVISTTSGKKYNVSIAFGCDCGGQGNPFNNKTIKNRGFCSHIKEVMTEILKNDSIFVDTDYQDQKQMIVNSALNLIRVSNRKLNIVRSSESETIEHREKKEEICKVLEILGFDYITEARLVNGKGIADIFIPELLTVIEIAKTESNKSLEKKKEVYPEFIKIKVVRM